MQGALGNEYPAPQLIAIVQVGRISVYYGMRLLYISKIQTNQGWGAETFLNQAFQQIGVETICIDYEQHRYKLARQLLEIQDNFDAFLLQRGCGYLFPTNLITAIHRPRFLLFTELVARNVNQYLYLNSHLFDHIFFRSFSCQKWAVNQHWLSFQQTEIALSAFNPDWLISQVTSDKPIDVLFIGTPTLRRKRLLDQLSRHFRINIQRAFSHEMVRLFTQAKIVLNIHAEDFLDTETRVYEVLGSGSFLITEKLSAENPFLHGTHLIESTSDSEMEDFIAYYLAHDQKRAEIAHAGQQEVLLKHTYRHRAQQICNTIQRFLPLQINTATTIDQTKLQVSYAQEKMEQLKDWSARVLGQNLRPLKNIIRK